MEFKPEILALAAARLQKQVISIVVTSVVVTAVVGAGIAFGVTASGAVKLSLAPGVLIAIGAVGGGLIGAVRGLEKAFTIRVRIQEILCLMRIEENTRPKA